MTAISDLFIQIRTFWQEASTPTRAAIAGSGVFLLILAVGLTFWAASPDFVSVYTGTPLEAKTLAKELEKSAIPYRISDDGGVISVRRADAGRARQVAGGVTGETDRSAGLNGIAGMGPFTTYEQQRVRIERAREEAIEQVLSQYSGVQKAAVDLALPEDNARVGENTPPKAAVTLTPLASAAFDDATIAAMAYVVAYSIPDLTPENVTIASTAGGTLWSGGDSASGTTGNGALKTRTRAEREFIRTRQADLQANLDRVFGPRKAVVYVDATLDLDKQEIEEKRIVPNDDGKGTPVSEQNATEQYSGAPAPVGGPAGIAANLPGTPSYRAETGAGGAGRNFKRTEETTNYDNSTRLERTTKAVGEAKRLNVSVFVDRGLPVEVQQGIESWLRGAVINPTNAATTAVTMVAAPFDTTMAAAAKTAQAASEKQAMMTAYAPYIVLPIVVLLLLLGAWLLTRRGHFALTAPAPELALAGAGGMTMPLPGTRVEDLLLTAEGNAPEVLEEMEMPQAQMRPIGEKAEPELEAILDFIDKRPETAALLLRSWTAEEKRG